MNLVHRSLSLKIITLKYLFAVVSSFIFIVAFVACSDAPKGPEGPPSKPGNPGSASAPGSFERILAHIPDVPDSRDSLVVIDIAKVREELEIDRPSDTATADQIAEYQIAMHQGANAKDGIGTGLIRGDGRLSGWVQSSGKNESTTYDTLGIDSRNVDQYALFGSSPTFASEVLLGEYSPDTTAERLAACDDCEPHEVVQHGSTDSEYYVWSEDFEQDLRKRLAKPAFDHFGRGGRIFVQGGMATRTLSNEHIDQIIDASLNVEPSLADDPNYASAAVILANNEVAIASFTSRITTVNSSIEALEKAWEHGLQKGVTSEEVVQQFSKAHLLLPWKMAAIGTAFPDADGESPATYAVLVHSSESDAKQNAIRLEERIEQDEYLLTYNLPGGSGLNNGEIIGWVDFLTDYSVWVEGNAVVLKATGTEIGHNIARAILSHSDDVFFVHTLLTAE